MFSRYNRLVDSSPKRDIHRCDVVSSTSIAASLTSEIVSGRSIGLSHIAARWTSSRSIPRINKDQRNTRDLCLVVHKHSKQSKIPSMQAATLRHSNRNSVSNALKIFKGDRSQSVFGFRNKLFGNAMVNVFGEPGNLTRKFLKMAFSRFSTFALESGFQRITSIPSLVNLFPGMYFSIAIYSQILDTKINTENANRIIRRCFVNLNYHTKIKDPFNEDQIRLTSNSVHSDLLIISKSNGDNLPALESNQGNFLKSFPGENALIIDDSTIQSKLWFNGLVSLVGFANLGNGSDRKLGGKPEMFSNRIVNRLMDLNLVGTMQSKNCLCYVITRLVKPLHGFKEHLMLLRGGIEFYHQGLKHSIEDYLQWIYIYGWGTLLSGLKTGVSATPTPRSVL